MHKSQVNNVALINYVLIGNIKTCAWGRLNEKTDGASGGKAIAGERCREPPDTGSYRISLNFTRSVNRQSVDIALLTVAMPASSSAAIGFSPPTIIIPALSMLTGISRRG